MQHKMHQREFLGIDDLLHTEELEVKKFQYYANQCTNVQLKQVLNDAASRHQRHFNTLLSIINQSEGGTQGTMTQ